LVKLDRDGDGKVSAAELRPQGGGRRDEEVVGRMMSFDKNGDGKLSAEELPDRMQDLMARADSNKDGFLTREELTQAPPRGRMAGMDPVLAAVDVDRDGTLSAGEMQEAAAAIAKLDKNGDGKLTREELRASAAGGRRPGGRRR
jgi:Ca2+-binding EF-hand superfamily protein